MIVDSNSQIGRYTEIRRTGTADELVGLMDKYGVAKTIISQITRDMQGDNASVRESVKKHPERLVPLAHVDPTAGDRAIEELRRCVKELGFKGIKLNPLADAFWPIEDSIYKLYDEVQRLGIPVLCHSGTYPFSMPLQFAYVARQYPRIDFILGHAGFVEASFEAIPAARWSDNIYFETSGCAFAPILEDLVKEAGAERVLFGVNYPYQNHAIELRRMDVLNLTSEERESVLGENARRIFHIQSEPSR